MDKKSILKKACCGQGGPITDAVKGAGRFIKSIPGKVVGKVKQVVKDRVQAQKNWENRKDNSNYYGSVNYFKNKK